MTSKVPAQSAARTAIVEQLSLLAEPAAQLSYAQAVPIADISSELVSGWFDDSYFPDSPEFCGQFNSAELEQLRSFSLEFENLLHEAGGSLSALSELHESEAWLSLCASARRVLGVLEGHAA